MGGGIPSGHRAAGFAEDLEEGVPERFGLGVLPRGPGPFAGEPDGAVSDLVPGKGRWHGFILHRMGENRNMNLGIWSYGWSPLISGPLGEGISRLARLRLTDEL